MATICRHHVIAAMQGIPQANRDQVTLLGKAGINPNVIETPNQRVHTEQVARLFQLVMLTLDDEFMGFSAAPSRVGSFALMSELIPQCLTLGEQLRKSAKFYNITHPGVDFRLVEIGSEAHFTINLSTNTHDEEHFLREFLLVIWHRFPSWLVGAPIPLKAVEFSFVKPAHHQELNVMFPCRIAYGKPHNRLIFDRRYLQKNLTRTRQELEDFVNRSPFDIMTIPGREQTLESQIERLLAPKDSEQAGLFTLQDVATALRISPQTIQRRLAQHDTSFNTIKENWRREKALKMLQTTQFSIEEISERLGFAEARSFTRAFKNWTGLSPRKFRKMF